MTKPTSVGAGRAADGAARNLGPVAVANLDGTCNRFSNGNGDLCLWYSANFGGSYSDFYNAVSNLNNTTYLAAGSGQGQVVGNNAESVLNFDLFRRALLWTGINATGSFVSIAPGYGGTFGPGFINNVESIRIGAPRAL